MRRYDSGDVGYRSDGWPKGEGGGGKVSKISPEVNIEEFKFSPILFRAIGSVVQR